jgi:hypothetical protein
VDEEEEDGGVEVFPQQNAAIVSFISPEGNVECHIMMMYRSVKLKFIKVVEYT